MDFKIKLCCEHKSTEYPTVIKQKQKQAMSSMSSIETEVARIKVECGKILATKKNTLRRMRRATTPRKMAVEQGQLDAHNGKLIELKACLERVQTTGTTTGTMGTTASSVTHERETSESVESKESRIEESSSSRKATVGQTNINKRVNEVEVNLPNGTQTIHRTIASSEDTSFRAVEEEQKHSSTYMKSVRVIRTGTVRTIVQNAVDNNSPMNHFRGIVRVAGPSASSIGSEVMDIVDGYDYFKPLSVALLYMINAGEPVASTGAWHSHAIGDIVNRYEVAIKTDEESDTAPVLLPAVIASRWMKMEWQELGTVLFSLNPMELVKDAVEKYLGRRRTGDMRWMSNHSKPVMDYHAEFAVRMTAVHQIGYQEAKYKLIGEVEAFTRSDPDAYRKEWDRREGELDKHATNEQMEIMAKYIKDMTAWNAGERPTGAISMQLTKDNVEAVERVLECYRIGFGTLLVSKLLASIEYGDNYGPRSRSTDITPSSLVTTTTSMTQSSTSEPVTIVSVIRANGKVELFAGMTTGEQRDVRRGFGVGDLKTAMNPSVRQPTYTGQQQDHFKQLPRPTNYVRLIQANGNWTEEDWRELMRSPLDRVDHLGQTVLSLTLRVYTSPVEGVVTEYMTKGVKVCPAPADVIALFDRITAEDMVNVNHRTGVNTRTASRAVDDVKRKRQKVNAERARTSALHVYGTERRQRAELKEMDRLESRDRQEALRAKLGCDTWWQ
jgi:hypothetical protein